MNFKYSFAGPTDTVTRVNPVAINYLSVISHDVVEPGQEPETCGDLRMHGAVHVVEQVQGLQDQVITLLDQPLLDLRLTTREKVIRITCL